jgi:hypothetical protein
MNVVELAGTIVAAVLVFVFGPELAAGLSWVGRMVVSLLGKESRS